MNPQHNESAGMQLPPPVMEQAPAGSTVPENSPQNVPEKGQAAGPEMSPLAQTQAAQMPAMPMPMAPPMPAQGQQAGVSNTTTATAQLQAADNDLIEKEWVNKAKQIVDSTRDDPYRQSNELTEVKVDYLQKRYGKTIKMSK